MNLQELKLKGPTELLQIAEELEVENASTLRKQELIDDLKAFLKDYDMTSITTNELKKSADGFMKTT